MKTVRIVSILAFGFSLTQGWCLGKQAVILYPVSMEGRKGFMNRDGTVIINPQFLEATPFSEGLAAVKTGDFWGFIDRLGRIVIPARYNAAYSFSEGLAAVKDGNKWGYIDKRGKTVIAA